MYKANAQRDDNSDKRSVPAPDVVNPFVAHWLYVGVYIGAGTLAWRRTTIGTCLLALRACPIQRKIEHKIYGGTNNKNDKQTMKTRKQ